jgi:hypothetical protein
MEHLVSQHLMTKQYRAAVTLLSARNFTPWDELECDPKTHLRSIACLFAEGLLVNRSPTSEPYLVTLLSLDVAGQFDKHAAVLSEITSRKESINQFHGTGLLGP